jgi:Flp pilus assembly protein TadD
VNLKSKQSKEALQEARKAHDADRAEPKAALRYARLLRRTGEKSEAMAVLERASTKSIAVQTELGLMALDHGDAAKAEALLLKALDPSKPDWRILNGLGAAQAALGRPAEGIVYLRKANELKPNTPSVMNNLALALILDRQIEEGERILRKAVTTAFDRPRIRQNLALALSLKGDHQEAVKVASNAAMTEAEARANVAYLKGLTEGRELVRRAKVEPSSTKAPSAPVATRVSTAN